MERYTRLVVRLTLLALGLITVRGLMLRCYGLTTRGAWWDEAAVWAEALSAQQMFQEAPLHTWLVRWTMQLWHRNDALALHVPAVVAGILTIPAAYRLGRALAGTACGLATALLVMLSPVAVYFSQEARPYSLLILLTTLQMALAIELLTAWSLRRLFWLCLATAAALATHLLALPFAFGIGAVVGVALLWPARVRESRRAALRRAFGFGVAYAAAAAIGAAWTLFRPSLAPVLAGHYTFGVEAFLRYVMVRLNTFSVYFKAEPQPWAARDTVGAIFALVALAGLVTLLVRRQFARAAIVIVPAVIVLVGLYLQLGDKSVWIWTRYATPAMMPLLVLAATALTASRRWWIALPLVLALCTLDFRDGTGLPAWVRDAKKNRLVGFKFVAQVIRDMQPRLNGVIFIQQQSIYGDETNRATASFALTREDDLPLYWEHQQKLYRVPMVAGPGNVPVPILSDDGPLELQPGDYAVLDGWSKVGCANFSPRLSPSPVESPPASKLTICRWN